MRLMNRSIAACERGGTTRAWSSIRGDLAVLAGLLILAVLAAWFGPQVGGGIPRGDSFAFFIPMYTFMSDQLRSGSIPG